MVTLSLLIGGCLNPINFSEEDLPRIPVDVSGSLEVSVKDVAVMWLINRTKDVNVTLFEINREKAENEDAEDYNYPKNYTNKPAAGQSLASYHAPTEIFYTVKVEWEDKDGGTGVFAPFEVQFPRPADYRYYLYWTMDGELVLVHEEQMTDLKPDPNKNFPDPGPSSVDAQTFVVLNVTDQGIDAVEFTKDPYVYVMLNEPRAKDQEMILLVAGSYDAKASYTKGGTQYSTTVKTAIVTKEDGSMAVRTNYLYFYKTKTGDYQLTQTWPPIPNDASDENKPEDALLDTQGILRIVNNAVPNNPHALIARINISGDEFPNSTNTTSYMAPGDDPKVFIRNVGPVYVSFRPTDQTYYGQVSEREILSKQVTTLSYINDLGNPFAFPEDNGKGTGLIRITNNSRGVVVSAVVYNKSDISKSLPIGYEGFNPPYAINYGKVGLVPVVGTDEVPLTSDPQLIQVLLETVNGLVTVEEVRALKDQIVDIVINESSLDENRRAGSRVRVINNTDTPATILGLYVYNQDNEASTAVFPLDISNPPKGNSQELYVLSTVGLPIVQGDIYKARLTVYGNGKIGVIDKNFESDGLLYSLTPDTHTRTVTLTQGDLESGGLVEEFKPVTGITISPSPAPVNSTTESDLDGGSKALRAGGSINLNLTVVVAPADASKRSPISWTVQSGGGAGYVSLNPATGILTVTGIAPEGSRTVTLTGTIENAAGTVTGKTNFSALIQVILTYTNIVRTAKVSEFTLRDADVQAGTTLDLRTLLESLTPSLANIDGVPITAADIIWTITNTGGTGSSIGSDGFTFTAGITNGDVTIQGTLPGTMTTTGQPLGKTTNIHIVSGAQPFKAITSVSLGSSTPKVYFFTKNEVHSGAKRKIVSLGGELILTSYLQYTPADATNRLPVWWEAVGGDTANTKDKVLFRPNTIRGDFIGKTDNLVVKQTYSDPLHTGEPLLGSLPLPTNGEKVKVKATVVNGAGTSSNYVSPVFDVIMEEIYSNNVVDLPSDFWLDNPVSISVGQQLDLKTIAHLPAGASWGGSPGLPPTAITTDDLEWAMTGGAATRSGTVITGTAAGTVTVTATLPAAKNAGTPLVRTRDITVTSTYPANFTLRIIKQNSSDYVSQIVLVPVTNDNYGTLIRQTGHTTVRWAFGSGKGGVTKKSEFMKEYPNAPPNRYLTITKIDKTNDWADISIPWPSGSVTGYHLFFIEGDSRVRGYVNPGQLDPYQDENFLFFLRPDYLYDNYRLWMKADKQATSTTSGALEVIPIGYDSYKNTASIMKSQGVGSQPRHDLSDF
jgi:hypothetical protein